MLYFYSTPLFPAIPLYLYPFQSWGFQNWYKSQPNPGKSEHCVTFNYWGKKNSQWGDRKCLLSKPFLCETMGRWSDVWE